MIKLISLDAWNTLLRLDRVTKSIASRLGEQVGLDGESVFRIMINVYNDLKPKWASGLIDDSMIVEIAQRALAERLHSSWDFVVKAVVEVFNSIDPCELIYPDTWDVLEDLSREFRLAVVSNVFYWPGGLTRRVIEGAGLSRFLEAQLYADETGIAKPDRRIFMKLCGMLGISSGEAVHVGDELMEDVGGAISSGMKAALIKRDAMKPLIIRELDLAIIPRLSDLRHVLMEFQRYTET